MERNSSIEIYRIIATFAVLVYHFNGWLVGGVPKYFDIDRISSFRITQALIESSSCICVNMFIVISGYFGLRLKWQSVLKICFLLLSVHIPFYMFDCLFFDATFVMKEFVRKFLIVSNGGYFIQCYLMLMFLSPIINSFVEKADRKKGLFFTLMFVGVEFWFDCITHTDYFGFQHGYSVMHFIVVYMIARYVFIYREELLRLKRCYWVAAYIASSLIILTMYVCGVNFIWQYSNPMIIISAVCSFIPFLYKSFSNKWINWIASSTLAVYIIHVTVPVYDILVKYDSYILEYYNYPIYLLLALSGVIVLFVISIIYDKFRLLFTNPIYNSIIKFIEK